MLEEFAVLRVAGSSSNVNSTRFNSWDTNEVRRNFPNFNTVLDTFETKQGNWPFGINVEIEVEFDGLRSINHVADWLIRLSWHQQPMGDQWVEPWKQNEGQRFQEALNKGDEIFFMFVNFFSLISNPWNLQLTVNFDQNVHQFLSLIGWALCTTSLATRRKFPHQIIILKKMTTRNRQLSFITPPYCTINVYLRTNN